MISFFKNLKWNLFNSASQLLLGTFFTILAANSLGAEQFGYYALTIAFFSITNTFIEIRSQDLIILIGACNQNNKFNKRKLLQLILLEAILRLGITLIAVILVKYFDFNILLSENEYFTLSFILFSFSKLFYEGGISLLRLLDKTRLIAKITIFELSFRILFLYSFIPNINYEALLLISTFSTLLMNIFIFLKVSSFINFTFAKAFGALNGFYYLFLLKYKKFLLLNITISYSDLFNKDLDLYIASFYLHAADIGQYKIAKTVAQSIWKVLDAYLFTVTPIIYKNIYKKSLLFDFIKKYAPLTILFSILVAVTTYIFFKYFSIYLLGYTYSNVHENLPFFLVGIVLSSALIFGYPISVGLKKSKYIIIGSLIGSITAIIFLTVLNPYNNLKIIAISWSISIFISSLITSILALNKLMSENENH